MTPVAAVRRRPTQRHCARHTSSHKRHAIRPWRPPESDFLGLRRPLPVEDHYDSARIAIDLRRDRGVAVVEGSAACRPRRWTFVQSDTAALLSRAPVTKPSGNCAGRSPPSRRGRSPAAPTWRRPSPPASRCTSTAAGAVPHPAQDGRTDACAAPEGTGDLPDPPSRNDGAARRSHTGHRGPPSQRGKGRRRQCPDTAQGIARGAHPPQLWRRSAAPNP